MSPSLPSVEWQPLVLQSVFITSSSFPKSVQLGSECNWSFWYQWCAGPRVACGKGFLKSVPHHSLLELAKPKRQGLLGIIKPSSGEWKSDRPKQSCKCFVLHVNWKRPKTERTGFCSLSGIYWCNNCTISILAIWLLGSYNVTACGKCSLNKWRRKVCHSSQLLVAVCVAPKCIQVCEAETLYERGHVRRE